MRRKATWFQRFVLPGFAFKAVVIGGGYATGRELATFFLPSGPQGGVLAMLATTSIWSVVCCLTFLFAFETKSLDYCTFFRQLLGPCWPIFEIAYVLSLIVIAAVFAAAAGAIGRALFGLPQIAGTLALVMGIALIAAWGNEAVERLFKYVTIFLYGTYAIFVILDLSKFGDQTIAALQADVPMTNWAMGGATYAGYNILGAVVVLPALRHLTCRRDAAISGLLAGPMAIAPALLFFVCMCGFYPQIKDETLPSDYMLARLDAPGFRVMFEMMVLAALLESGTGGLHAVNERIAQAWGKPLSAAARFLIAAIILAGSVFFAARFGLVSLVASGYRWISYAILAIYVAPLMTLGLARVMFLQTSQRVPEA